MSEKGFFIVISYISGVLVSKQDQAAVVDVGGIGLKVLMPLSSYTKLPDIDTKVTLLTSFQIREDSFTLYGFFTNQEKDLFVKLLSVSGVGPKVALAALSFYSSKQLVDAIVQQDPALVSKIPGVGKKTAERIILELKGHFDQDEMVNYGISGNNSGQRRYSESVMSALLSMGFTQQESELALKGAPDNASESTLLHYALKQLGTNN